jgi:DNA-3-methyladenine glycosylase
MSRLVKTKDLKKEIVRQVFFQAESHQVAENLIGLFLLRIINKDNFKVGRIVEVEVYRGFDDKASHASKKKTSRNEIMYGKGGFYYVYLIYGMYYCLNIVTENKNFPSAILIRATEPIYDSKKNLEKLSLNEKRVLGSGPGRLCHWLEIDKSFNEQKVENDNLFLVDKKNLDKLRPGLETGINPPKIKKAKRVGVHYAGESAHLDWRYYDARSDYVSVG